jgi:gamma-glutamyltranspeptidase
MPGNVVSFIYSIYNFFGSGVTVPGYGFLLNDRAAAFSLRPDSPNVIAPGKRPFYTLVPGFVTKDGKPFLSFGVMYGDQQAQGQAQVLVNMLAFGANPQRRAMPRGSPMRSEPIACNLKAGCSMRSVPISRRAGTMSIRPTGSTWAGIRQS